MVVIDFITVILATFLKVMGVIAFCRNQKILADGVIAFFPPTISRSDGLL